MLAFDCTFADSPHVLLAANDHHIALEAVANSRCKAWYPHNFRDVIFQQFMEHGNPAQSSTASIEYRGARITSIKTSWRTPVTSEVRKVSRGGVIREVRAKYGRGPMEHMMLVLAVTEDLKHDKQRGGVARKRIETTGRAKRCKIEPNSVEMAETSHFVAAAQAYAGTPLQGGGGEE